MMYINKANILAVKLLSCRDTCRSSVLRGGSEHCTPKSQASFDILRDVLRKNPRVISGILKGIFGCCDLSAFGFDNLSCYNLTRSLFEGISCS